MPGGALLLDLDLAEAMTVRCHGRERRSGGAPLLDLDLAEAMSVQRPGRGRGPDSAQRLVLDHAEAMTVRCHSRGYRFLMEHGADSNCIARERARPE